MLIQRHLRDWLPAASTGLVLLIVVGLAVLNPSGAGVLRRWVFDSFQQQQPRSPSELPVFVVDIDQDSLERFGQWPWPRSRHAQLLEALRAAGVRLVVLDVMLSEPDRASPAQALANWKHDPAVRDLLLRMPDYDESLAAAMSASSAAKSKMSVVMGFVLTHQEASGPPTGGKTPIALRDLNERPSMPSYSSATPPLPLLEAAASGSGAVNLTLDGDGVIRHVPTVLTVPDPSGEVDRANFYPSLALEAARVYLGETVLVAHGHTAAGEPGSDLEAVSIGGRDGKNIATDAHGRMWLHHAPFDPKRSLPAWRVLDEDFAETLQGALVVVGSSAPGLDDLHLSPLSRTEIPGVEIQAQAIEQILDGTFLTRPSWSFALELIITLLAWAAVSAAVLRLGPLAAAATTVTLLVGLISGSFLAFSRSLAIIDPVWPVLCTVTTFAVASVARWMIDEADKRWVRSTFSSYISPNLVDYLIAHPEALARDGVRRQCSFVVSDLADFSALVDASEPEVAVAILNEYVAGLSQVILDHGGTIDRVVGDAVAAMFSAPVEQADHSRRALDCALAMQRFAAGFRQHQRELGREVDVTRIGVHCGLVTVGNVGGDALIDYRALGNAINMAARLETANKVLGTETCVSAELADAAGDFIGRPVGELLLAGRETPLATLEPLTPEQAATPAIQAYVEAYVALRDGADSAAQKFREVLADLPEDPLARLHLARLERGETGVVIDIRGGSTATKAASEQRS